MSIVNKISSKPPHLNSAARHALATSLMTYPSSCSSCCPNRLEQNALHSMVRYCPFHSSKLLGPRTLYPFYRSALRLFKLPGVYVMTSTPHPLWRRWNVSFSYHGRIICFCSTSIIYYLYSAGPLFLYTFSSHQSPVKSAFITSPSLRLHIIWEKCFLVFDISRKVEKLKSPLCKIDGSLPTKRRPSPRQSCDNTSVRLNRYTPGDSVTLLLDSWRRTESDCTPC